MHNSNNRNRVDDFVPHTSPTAQCFIVLPNGRQILEELALSFRDQVLRKIPELEYDRSYTLKQICGAAFWRLLSATEARTGGMYIAQLVADGQLPLEFANCPHAVPKRYRRI